MRTVWGSSGSPAGWMTSSDPPTASARSEVRCCCASAMLLRGFNGVITVFLQGSREDCKIA
ncbi:hypothetical protein SERLA73DRAFT_138605 [Serpula lacrymans var. lacrymans S7.3]|uniref:Uncharacterized protein n=2 Tax=Serpula lacrymans var. lacrymans TaxID=341189 RepID=F8PZD5_SERL3|nr:uncharacterized protein SERLADRAFT_392328 [Serpula lacrymans var. lacrymans S7.9]EGN98257.1 hypothetical protein SERLA73DRAFT_138605 [Serpula lacrymans var. lacrymans S7.3]EGO23830.1 hypothetical protein SERLADRAFT_392328 [Serpula lacrymans var. lacrymans S7.9]